MYYRWCFFQNGLTCPTCKKVYGTKTGDMPDSGNMGVSRTSRSLPGHPGYSTIEIVYNFTSGISVSILCVYSNHVPS